MEDREPVASHEQGEQPSSFIALSSVVPFTHWSHLSPVTFCLHVHWPVVAWHVMLALTVPLVLQLQGLQPCGLEPDKPKKPSLHSLHCVPSTLVLH